MIAPFAVARLPRIEFGAGALARLPAIVSQFGRRLLLVSGARSLRTMPQWPGLQSALRQAGLHWEELRVSAEPSPQLVDQAVAAWGASGIEVVLGIGGGSVLDAAKAVAGLLVPGNPVMDHLEGVGRGLPYKGPALPFVAVPTTAGTGSEATRNAVLSMGGENGFKKSFRDERLVAQVAVVDPDLLAGCPPPLIAANGMDAFTQLLESYVSTGASPFTDALALSGLEAVRDGLPAWHADPAGDADARSRMAYGALLSGITLAQAGLGAVHGLASPLGAFFPIPHGVACGSVVAAATRVNIAALKQRAPDSPALARYARAGRLLAGGQALDDEAAQRFLVGELERWADIMALPPLSDYGVARADFPRIVAHSRGSSMKTNPIVLSDAEIEAVLASTL